MYKATGIHCGCPNLVFIPDSMNMLDLTTADAIAVEQAQDVIMLAVSFTKGADSLEDAVNINDTSMEGLVFATWAEAITYLNTTFRTTHSLKGTFNRSAKNYINYNNYEKFVSGSIDADYGLFEPVFDNLFD